MKLTLSKHLFWDVNPDTLDEECSKELIILRTLQYGLMTDWQVIKDFYGITAIAEVASKARELDLKSVAFVSLLAGIPRETFLAYSEQSSMPKHWV